MSKQKHKKFIVSLERHLYQTDKILGGGMLGCPPHCMNPSLAKILWLTIHQHKYIMFLLLTQNQNLSFFNPGGREKHVAVACVAHWVTEHAPKENTTYNL